MSLVSSMNIAQQALSVSQAAITVISNNIANVDTEGYSKLRANQASVVNASSSTGSSAILIANSLSGVKLSSVTRYADSYLTTYYQQENSVNSYLEQYSTVANNIQNLTNELNDAGLSDALSSFYEAANSLNNTPSDITARQNFISAADNVCTVFNTMSQNLSNIQKSLVGTVSDIGSSEVSGQINEVNSLLEQIAEVNKDIVKTNTGSASSSSLLDQRDALTTQLSSLIPIKTEENQNGTINISLGQNVLVEGATQRESLKVTNSLDASSNLVTTVSIVDADDTSRVLVPDVNDLINSGSIGAILDVAGTDSTKLTVSGVLGELNTMASAFASTMNAIQTDTSGTTTPMAMSDSKTLMVSTTNLFVNKDNPTATETTGITAFNIGVKSEVQEDPYLVAAARVTTITPPATYDLTAIGNNSNVQSIIASRDTNYATLGNTTMESYLSNMVTKVGSRVDAIDSNLANQSLVLETIETNLNSATGVNMDEELTDLIKYQRAYQAAGRIFSICNELLDTLISLGQ